MASLQGNTIKDTYKSLLKVADNGELEAGLQEITDGDGNGTGVSLNTSGDVTATGTVAFGSIKDSGENITVTKFVDEADGIAANDNDTSIPTSAAVKDYVDTSAAGLQSQINTNDTDITALQAADTTLQNNINSEESARIAADSGLQTQINNNDSDITALQAADTTLQNNINAEESARIAADNTLQSNITAEATTRANADTALQTNINNEEAARIAADTTLQNNINTEANTRASADTSLQNQITSNDGDITGLDTRLTTAEGNITSNDGDISALDGRLTTAEGNITSNDTDISNLDSRLTTAEGNITSNDTDISNLQSGKQDISEKNQANGYAPLDAGAKIPIANIPDSVLGQVEYQGTYNASTDTPTLPAASTVKGDYYVVSVAGTYETISYAIGDWIISNGTAWEKVDNTDAVTTVFGRLGAVVANESDYSSFYPLISDLNTTNSNVSGLDGRLTTAEGDITAIETKTDFITVTQAVNLDTIESDVATNNAKISFDSASSSKLAGIEAGAEVNTVDSVNGATGVVVLSTSDLNDVSATAPTDNQVLVFDVALGVYVPETLSPAAPVDSVNGQTGVVVLDADDIDDTSTTHKFTNQTDIDKLAGIEAGADVTDATNVAAAGALMSGTAVLSDLVDVSSAAPADGQVLTFDTVNGWQPEDSQGEEYTISEISTNTNAQVGFLYVLTANLTLTLPASPSVGDKVALSNMSGTTTPVVARNGNLIAGLAEDLTIDVLNLSVEFIYSGASQGWIIFVDSILGTSGGGGSVDGNGTTNFISKWSDANTLTDSLISDNGTVITMTGAVSLTNGPIDGYMFALTNDASSTSYGSTNGKRLAFFRSDSTSIPDQPGIDLGYSTTGEGVIAGSTNATGTPIAFYIFDGANWGERARITTNGITFNGDTAAANALDDYEEGTWTPIYAPDTGAFGSITYASATQGKYTKIGNLVTLSGLIRTDAFSVGTASGGVSIAGIPFTSGSTVSSGSIGYACCFTGNYPTSMYVVSSGTGMPLIHTGSTPLSVSNLANGSFKNYIIFNAYYYI